MTKSKVPSICEAFGVEVFRLNAESLRKISDPTIKRIARGEVCPLAHWCGLEAVEDLLEDEDIGPVRIVLDESDELITNLTDDCKHTRREGSIRRLQQHCKVIGIISLTATQLGWVALVEKIGVVPDSRVDAQPEALRRVRYRGFEALKQLTVQGECVVIPEEPVAPARKDFETNADFDTAKEMYKEAKARNPFVYGESFDIKSRQVRQLFDDFHARQTACMFLSLGGRVHSPGGTDDQAYVIATDLAPGAAVFIVSSGLLTEWSCDEDGETFGHECVDGSGKKLGLSDALERCDKSHIVVLGQGSVGRGITFGVPITHIAVVVTKGFNLANLVHLVGRCNGRGYEGDVVALMRQSDFDLVRGLHELTDKAIDVCMAGQKSFLNCRELSDPRFEKLLTAKRPLNKKKVLEGMPKNCKRMFAIKRQREGGSEGERVETRPASKKMNKGITMRVLTAIDLLHISGLRWVPYRVLKESPILSSEEDQKSLLNHQNLVWGMAHKSGYLEFDKDQQGYRLLDRGRERMRSAGS